MTKPLTGADLVMQAAADVGIDVCFANPGTSEMHMVGALDGTPGIRPVLGLHETVCTGAADGYARMTRHPAMTLLHLGPGLANGLANLHNARRARSPVVNIVGDMARWHASADALLNMDIPALAGTVSARVVKLATATDAARELAAAAGERGVTTLIVPHDVSWAQHTGGDKRSGAAAAVDPVASRATTAEATTTAPTGSQSGNPLPEGAMQFIRDLAAAMRSAPPGKLALYCGGAAALRNDGALHAVGQIAAATGATMLCENAFARVDRGAGLPALVRVPYFPQDAQTALSKFDTIVFLDSRRPVAMFGYEGGPSQLVSQPDEKVWELDAQVADVPALLAALRDELGAGGIVPGKNCRGTFAPSTRPPLPRGRLTATAMCTVVAALQPEDCIVVDESITSGGAYWAASAGCPSFSHLTLTGGAIGCGIPLALGAALARPAARVITLQADGSGLYSAQGLWSQARERARVLTIVCANRTYAILKIELAKQHIAPGNGPAAQALTDIGRPAIDWVALATGFGVPAVQVQTCEELAEQVKHGLELNGPMLIEALL